MRLPAALYYFKRLNGIFCVYKNAGITTDYLKRFIASTLTEHINKLEQRPLKQRVLYNEDNWGTDKSCVTLVDDLSDHVLVKGPRFRQEDFILNLADSPHEAASGLTVLGVNECPELEVFRKANYLKVYHLKGRFGRATSTFTNEGNVNMNTSWRHVKQQQLDRILSLVQAHHQKNMFVMSNVNLQSQEAYELAAKGLVRSKLDDKAGPVIYGVRCIHFDLPEFTLEVHCVNETMEYLARLIHEIGIQVRSSAFCTQARRIRWGNLTLDDVCEAPYSPPKIAYNIKHCSQILRQDSDDVSDTNLIRIAGREDMGHDLLPLLPRTNDNQRDSSVEKAKTEETQMQDISKRSKESPFTKAVTTYPAYQRLN